MLVVACDVYMQVDIIQVWANEQVGGQEDRQEDRWEMSESIGSNEGR